MAPSTLVRAMPRSCPPLALIPTPPVFRAAARLTTSATASLASLTLLALLSSTAAAQPRAAYETPLHLPANRFEFVASGEAPPPAKPLRIHNGSTARFTDVALTRVTYVDSARGAGWLVAVPRQTAVAPEELATVGTLCVDAAGLKAGTYHATAAVRAREVPEPVAITVTLVVTDAGARARRTTSSCGAAVTK